MWRVGEVLFASNVDSPRSGRTRVLRVRSWMGGFIRWYSRRPRWMPPICKNKKEVAMDIEFYFRFKLKPKTKKVTVVVDEQ